MKFLFNTWVFAMTDVFLNPFLLSDADRHGIWTMLVERDITAFLAADWDMVAGDFIEDGFLGIDAKHSANPDDWRLTFPTLDAYRDKWLAQAMDFQEQKFSEDSRTAIFKATTLCTIEIVGDMALVHKKFDGGISRTDGGYDIMNWQTLYHCRCHEGRWKIIGFNGYMPYPVPTRNSANQKD